MRLLDHQIRTIHDALFLLDTVEKERRHLELTTGRLFTSPIDAAWVASLEGKPDLAERLDAFVARFGRMQDTLGDKLIPELMRNLLESPGAALDNLNRMEKLGLRPSVGEWVEARNLRNRLVHEYMQDAGEFAAASTRARDLVPILVESHELLDRYARGHFSPSSGERTSRRAGACVGGRDGFRLRLYPSYAGWWGSRA